MHLVLGLLILGALIYVAMGVFSIFLTLLVMAVALPISGINWLFHKIRG